MSTVESAAAIPQDLVWRLSVNQYHAMIQAGILTDDDPVELLEGWLIFKMPKNPAHRVTTRLIRTGIEQVLPAEWYVDSQEPITLRNSEPEPDVVIVRGDTRQYLDRHPGAGDVALVIEVAETTLERDRTLKKQAYAQAGIPAYWIVNLSSEQIEVYTQPSGSVQQPGYALRQDYGRSDVVPVLIEGVKIGALAVNVLLP